MRYSGPQDQDCNLSVAGSSRDFTYRAVAEVLEDILVDTFNTMYLLVVKRRVRSLTFEGRDFVSVTGFMLHMVGDVHILAEVFWQVLSTSNLDAEKDLLALDLFWVINYQLVFRLSLTSDVTRPVGNFKLAGNAALDACVRGKDLNFCILV